MENNYLEKALPFLKHIDTGECAPLGIRKFYHRDH